MSNPATFKLTAEEALSAVSGITAFNTIRWGWPALSPRILNSINKEVAYPERSAWVAGAAVGEMLKTQYVTASPDEPAPMSIGLLFGMEVLTGFPDLRTDVLLCVTFDEDRKVVNHIASWIRVPAINSDVQSVTADFSEAEPEQENFEDVYKRSLDTIVSTEDRLWKRAADEVSEKQDWKTLAQRFIAASQLGIRIEQSSGHRWIVYDRDAENWPVNAFPNEVSCTKEYGSYTAALDFIDLELKKYGYPTLLNVFDCINHYGDLGVIFGTGTQ